MSLPWHPRNHQDALDGMLLLTLEERGAYNTVLDLIYQRSGPVPDDERWLAGWMGCSVKKWRLIRAALLVKGKLTACDRDGQPALMNERARMELESASTRRRVAAEAGAKGGRKTAQTNKKPNENNSTEQATLEGSLKLYTETDTEQETPTPAKASVGGRAKAPKPKASLRCPNAWFPTDADVAMARGEGFTPGEIDRELSMIRDHEFRTAHSDWSAVFRNWIRRAAKNRAHDQHHRIPTREQAPDARRANTERRRDAWLDVVAERDGFPPGGDLHGGRAGGAGGDGAPHPGLAAPGDGPGDRDRDRGAGAAFPRLALQRS